MTVKELFVQILKDYPEGLWVHSDDFQGSPDYLAYEGTRYLDSEYETDFSDILSREVLKWYIDECDYPELEIKLK